MITQLIESTLKKKPGSVNSDDPLFSSKQGFDSFSLMEFVLQLEETFDISIPDDDLDPDIFQSVNTIVVYLSDKLE
jgi:acyl carrier protein